MSKTKLLEESITEAWRELQSDSVGASELELVRRGIEKEYGETATPGPASIARTLAEHGARLRHAEVLSADTSWRTRRLNELFSPGELDFRSIESSVESLHRLDELQIHLNSEGDETGLARLRDLVLELKDELQSVAKARLDFGLEQQVAAEVVEWLTIWLQTPHIFPDWLEIRRSSELFRKKFVQSTDSTDYTEEEKKA